jgi:hypothetical protein
MNACGICHAAPVAGYTQKTSDNRYVAGACVDCLQRYYRLTPQEAFMPPQQTQVVALQPDEAQLQSFVDKEFAVSQYRLAQIQQFVPNTQEGFDWAAGLAKQAKAEKDRVDGERTKITKPMREAIQVVQDKYMPTIRNYETMVALLKERMVECKKLIQAQQDAAALAAQNAYQQGNLAQLAVATQAMATSEFVAPPKVGTSVSWTFEIVDYQQIPGQFWCVNESAIQHAITQAKGQIQIPGVRVIRKEGVVLR